MFSGFAHITGTEDGPPTLPSFGLADGIAASYGQLAMNEGLRCLSVTTGSSLLMLWPMMTALGGLTFFDERFTPLQVAGAVLILIATWVVSTQKT